MSGSRSMAGCDEVVAEWPAPLRGAGGLTPGRGTWRGPRLPASGSSAPARGAAYGRDISHSCRSPASAARCSGSIVPAVLSAPNTGLRQPHEQTAWAPPSPASWMVVWWSTAIGVLEVNDRAAYRPRYAVEGLDPGGCQLGQFVDVLRLCPGNDVVGSRHARRLQDARQAPQRRSHRGRLAGFGLDQNVRRYHVTPTQPSRDYSTAITVMGHARARGDTAGKAWTRP